MMLKGNRGVSMYRKALPAAAVGQEEAYEEVVLRMGIVGFDP